VNKSIRIPCRTIAENAGKEGAIVVGKLIEANDKNLGYDAAKDQYVNMITAGIIDPTKVVRRALIDSTSVASLMITTECMIVDAKDKDSKEGGGGGGGMGGMGGMPPMY